MGAPLQHREQCLEDNLRRRPLMRETPDDLEEKGIEKEDVISSRMKEMQTKIQRRSQGMQNEWAKRTKQVDSFLIKHGFFGVNSKKRCMFSFTYPLHVAAKDNDTEMIQLLLFRDADPKQLDSKGRTPLQVAAKKCK